MLNLAHITLRKLCASDAPYLLAWENDKANWSVSQTAKPFNEEDIIQFVNEPQNIHHRNQLRLMICNQDQPIGCVDLFEYDEQQKRAGVGILIADKSFRNKGCATIALNKLKNYARNELQLVHLFCNIQSNNQASLRLFEKCGFHFVNEQDLNGETVRYFECKC